MLTTWASIQQTSWLSGTGRKSDTSAKRCGRAISAAPPKRLTGLQTSSILESDARSTNGGCQRCTLEVQAQLPSEAELGFDCNDCIIALHRNIAFNARQMSLPLVVP